MTPQLENSKPEAPEDLAANLPRFHAYLDHPSCGYECCGGGKVSMEPDAEGEWVKLSDVRACLAGSTQLSEFVAIQKLEHLMRWLTEDANLRGRSDINVKVVRDKIGALIAEAEAAGVPDPPSPTSQRSDP